MRCFVLFCVVCFVFVVCFDLCCLFVLCLFFFGLFVCLFVCLLVLLFVVVGWLVVIAELCLLFCSQRTSMPLVPFVCQD